MIGQIQSRSERRAMERAKEKHVKNLMKAGYTDFKDITFEPHTQETIAKLQIKPYQV